jgi:prolyl-tRNA editing enzyme YbaK/EbsC (Cys-tRNA(Pro) deacylase)
MSLTSVRAFLAAHAPDLSIIETPESTATVPLAAAVHGVSPGQIAKTLSIRLKDSAALLVVGGDSRMDNRRAKAAFGTKVKFVPTEDVEALTGHPVGGVCPIGLSQSLPVYCDVSLKNFDEVIPAAGSTNSSFRIHPHRLAVLAGGRWVDVCLRPGAAEGDARSVSAAAAGEQ